MLSMHYPSFFIMEINAGSLSNSRMWGPSKMPDLIFSYVNLGIFVQMYLKHSPFLSKALTNCFINPNFMCNGGKSTFFLYSPMDIHLYVLFSKYQHFSTWPFSFYPVFLLCSAISQAQEARVFRVATLLPKEHG